MNTLKLAKEMTPLLESMGWDINDSSTYNCQKCLNVQYSGPYCCSCGKKMEQPNKDNGTMNLKQALDTCLKGYEIKKRQEKLKKVVDKVKKK